MSKIWERYLLKLFTTTLLTVLFGFFALYVLIDYSCHTGYVHSTTASPLLHLATIYGCEFLNRIALLLPFAALIATIKTLTELNLHNELVALLASGLSLRRFFRPLLLVGLLLTALLYLNEQLALPKAKSFLKKAAEERKDKVKKESEKAIVQNLLLADESRLLYQKYDKGEKNFIDAFWIANSGEIVHFDKLYPFEIPPRGEGVEIFAKDSDGKFVRKESAKEARFEEMRFHKKRLWETTTLPEELPLTTLFARSTSLTNPRSEKQAALLTTFYTKMALPWLALLSIIAPASYCVRHSRTLSIFLLYATFTFLFIAFHLIMESAQVVGKRQILDPLVVVALPFGAIACAATYSFLRKGM